MGCHKPIPETSSPAEELLFRCNVCTRASHYEHMPQPDDDEPVDIGTLALYYQDTTGWKCHDCSSFVYPVDKIIAWRPYPRDAKDPPNADFSLSLPREYLIKWQDRPYKRVQWVPHMWMLATNRQRLRKFFQEGRTIKLSDHQMEQSDAKEAAQHAMMMDVDDEEQPIEDGMPSLTKRASLLAPVANAEERIPLGWRTVDRVLDVLLFKRPSKKLTIKIGKRRRVEDSDSELDPDAEAELEGAFQNGEQPAAQYTETIAEWQKRNKQTLSVDQVGDVVWAFFKWGDLGYEEGLSLQLLPLCRTLNEWV
jgi:chromodomain-helicase-DNA-binding protein 4